MSGYTRQSTADIIPTATVRAAPLNAEYNALRDAFAASGGHKHDGATGEGDYVPLIADADAKNKVQVNTSANTVDFYVEVSSVPVEQISIRDGVIRPITDNDIDLGATGAEFKDLYIDGIGYIDTLTVHENATVAGTLNVTGVITAPAGVVANLTGNVTGNLTGNVTGALTGDVTSTGTSTFADLDAVDLSATGTTVITSGDINSGTIDNSVIGNATPAAGTFTTLTANTSLTAATADINGGTLDGVVIGSGTSAAATVTDLTATGTSTLSTVDINAGAIDGTAIGASVPSTGAFTTVSTTGQATLASADINGGAIDGTTIGASVPATGTFTTVSASGGVTANVTGNLTGNVTGNVTGAITGNVTGDLTGNVTSAGSSSFNNVTIDGTLNMNAGTTSTITNLTSPTNANDAATKGYVDQEVSALVDSAPGTLDTLNELAAALGDDADFSTTVTNSIATKLPLAGGTMSGEIAMGSNKITGVTDPTGGQDASTKAYTDAQRDTRVAKVGDTMSGNLAMGANKVTGLAAPTDSADAATKAYVDTTNASNAAAATSATNAATSETNAATSETNAATSETNAGNSATAAAASYDSFDDRYLGAKSAAPTVDNDGDTLIVGALYFNSTTAIMYVYGSGGWQAAGSSVNGTSDRQTYTATAGQTVFAATYDPGYIDVYLNGVKLAPADFTATNGTSVTLASGAAVNDVLGTIAYGTFVLADHYTATQSDARYLGLAGGTMTGDIDGNGNKVLFGNVYSQLADLPSASTYHGMFAHVHATGKGYFAHAGAWVPLANETATLALSGGAMTGDLSFGDNDKAVFGAGSDLQIYHDGSNSYIKDAGTGNLNLQGENLALENTLGDNYLVGVNGSFVKLYHSGSEKLSTTATGIDVTGTVLSDGLTVDGLARIQGTATGLVINETDTTDLNSYITNNNGGLKVMTVNDAFSSFDTRLLLDHATGDISFYEDTGTTPKFFWDASAESLGIGTSSTGSETLVVEKSSGTPTIRINAPAGSQAQLKLQADGTATDTQMIHANTDASLAFSRWDGAAYQERMRLDASGNLLVGTTDTHATLATSSTLDGLAIGANSFTTIANDGRCLVLNRRSTDGNLLELNKDGTTVGSIGTNSGYIYVGSGDVNLRFHAGADAILPSTTGGTTRSDAIDLGTSGAKFKDGHFSGTVNTGSLTVTGTINGGDLRGEAWIIGRDTNDFFVVDPTQMRWYLDGAEDMRLVDNGDLHVEGNVIAYSSTVSDERLKTDIVKIDGALDKVDQLNGYTFTYTADGKKSAGVIAQEVQKVLPSAIIESKLPLKMGDDDETEYMTVQYDQLMGLMIEAIKELKAEVAELKGK